ncbi:hypothetical protein EJB05_50264, partial [Eragrostis curvula]
MAGSPAVAVRAGSGFAARFTRIRNRKYQPKVGRKKKAEDDDLWNRADPVACMNPEVGGTAEAATTSAFPVDSQDWRGDDFQPWVRVECSQLKLTPRKRKCSHE